MRPGWYHKRMKAICVHEFGPSSVLKYETVPDPTPGPGEVLIAVKAVGVNPVDTYIRAGVYGPREFPFTAGMDAAGVIEALGEGVNGVCRRRPRLHRHDTNGSLRRENRLVFRE